MAVTTTTSNIPDGAQTAGIPAQYREIWPDQSNALITGSSPEILVTDETYPANVTIPALTPVTITAGVIAVAADGTPADGITVIPVTTAAGESTTKGPIYRGGCFNPALINWPASYSTVEKKKRAFEGSKTPSQIVIREVKGYTDVQPFPA